MPLKIDEWKAIPQKTRSEELEESARQLHTLLQGEDLSNLCTDQRRHKRGGYSSIEELFKEEFKQEIPPFFQDSLSQVSQSQVTDTSIPVNEAETSVNFGLEQIVPTQNESGGYKMVLKESLKNESSAQMLLEVDSPSKTRPRRQNPSMASRKAALTNATKKSIRRCEASKRLLQESLSSQLKELNLEGQSTCAFSIGKHLFSNQLGSRLKVVIHSTARPTSTRSRTVRVRRLDARSIYQKAATLANQKYRFSIESCLQEPQKPLNSGFLSQEKILTFLEEGYLLILAINRVSSLADIRKLQVYSIHSEGEDQGPHIVQSLLDSILSQKAVDSTEIRVSDVILLLKKQVKSILKSQFSNQNHPLNSLSSSLT